MIFSAFWCFLMFFYCFWESEAILKLIIGGLRPFGGYLNNLGGQWPRLGPGEFSPKISPEPNTGNFKHSYPHGQFWYVIVPKAGTDRHSYYCNKTSIPLRWINRKQKVWVGLIDKKCFRKRKRIWFALRISASNSANPSLDWIGTAQMWFKLKVRSFWA